MDRRNSAFIVLAISLVTSVASAAEAAWPKNSASDLSIFVTLQRFRIPADHCSDKVPALKPQFDSLMEKLNSRIQGVSTGLLASDAFSAMKGKAVPAEIIFALKDVFADAKHNFERVDAESICPKTLDGLGEMDDEALKSGLRATLTAVQNMIQKLENESDR
jgi:hypothetical protein